MMMSARTSKVTRLVAPAERPPLAGVASGRAGVVGDLRVRGTEHQDLHELVEDDPVRGPRAVAPQRVRIHDGRDQGMKLVPEGFNDPRWDGGHGGT